MRTRYAQDPNIRFDEVLASDEDSGPANPLVDIPGRLYLGADQSLARDQRVSPSLAADLSGPPPALVITAECYFIRYQGSLCEASRQAGVEVKAIRYNGVGHALLDKVGLRPTANACIEDIAGFVRERGREARISP